MCPLIQFIGILEGQLGVSWVTKGFLYTMAPLKVEAAEGAVRGVQWKVKVKVDMVPLRESDEGLVRERRENHE